MRRRTLRARAGACGLDRASLPCVRAGVACQTDTTGPRLQPGAARRTSRRASSLHRWPSCWANRSSSTTRPAPSGTIAAAEVARAEPDGYTLGLLDNAPLTIVPALRNTGYDPLGAVHAPGDGHAASRRWLVASPSLPANNVRELIALMKSQPGRLNFGTGGAGSVGHLAAELFKQRTGTFALHVPFRGAAPVVTALLGGDLHFAFLTPTATMPFITSGKLKALGVSSGARLNSLPDVPTIAESGLPGYDVPGWFALMGPAGMPDATARRLASGDCHDPGNADRGDAAGGAGADAVEPPG